MSYWNNAVTVRTAEHRLILRRHNNTAATDVELYGVSADAEPFTNIAPDHSEIVEQLEGLTR